MNPATPTASPTMVFSRPRWRETAVLCAVAWFIPFAIHLAPWPEARPLGAYLLPMFWTTFVAVYFYGARVGLLVGLFAPVVNLLVTGLPAWRGLGLMSIELALFVLAATWAVRRMPGFPLIAPLAYVAAKVCSTALRAMTTVFGDLGMPSDYFVQSLGREVAGLIFLLAINMALAWIYPKAENETE